MLLYKTTRFHVAVRLSLIDNRKRQKVATPRVPRFCSYHILTSSVILLNRRTATWNVVVNLFANAPPDGNTFHSE